MNQGQLKELTDRLDALKESETTVKDEMYTNLRNYLEEQSGLLRQILAEQKRTNEMLAKAQEDKRKQLPVDKDGFVIAPAVADDAGQQVFTPKATIVDTPKTSAKPTAKKGK